SDTLVDRDPPEHTRLRRLIAPAFAPRQVEKLRARVDEIAREAIARAVPMGTFDLIEDYAHHVPAGIIAEVRGVRGEDMTFYTDLLERLEAVNGEVVGAQKEVDPEAFEQVKRVHGEYRAYFERVFADRRVNPQDDVITKLVQAESEGDRLDREELMKNVLLLS